MSSDSYVKDDHPSQIGPETTPRKSWSDRGRGFVKAFTTKEGLIGDYDYAFLFKPNLPFLRKERRAAPFFGLNNRMPVFLALLLGFQHALAMLAGVISPPIILAGAANLTGELQSYLVSTSLIVSGLLSAIQITRFHIWKTPYHIGTGLISVVGTSFSTITVATGALSQMYANGMCPVDAQGNQLPCPDGYGAIIGTQCCCALLEVLMSFIPPKFQVLSDLHLENPITAPRYDSFRLHVEAGNLFLLGDIGLVVHAELFQFLRTLLEQHGGCRIFYVLGNHELYQTTYENACSLMRNFEQEAKKDFGGRFIFLCRDRYDLNGTITILGCTLWSSIQREQELDISSRSADLSIERGIRDWSLERHREEHQRDIAWLNSQISMIESDEPCRQVIIVTHYSPTTHPRANDPRHTRSSVSSNFLTDLSQEKCWLSSIVKLWAFGHTHWCCEFLVNENGDGVRIVSNQRGYGGGGNNIERSFDPGFVLTL